MERRGAAHRRPRLLRVPTLAADATTLSLATGGTITFTLDAGPAFAGDTYFLVGSTTGTEPGIPLSGVTLPLVVDGYLVTTFTRPNTPPLANSLGTLDGSGRATATLTLPAGLPPALAGLQVFHAFLALDPVSQAVLFASSPARLTLAP